jgi:predicted Zn finger-like uncharacterized protein
MILTCEQCHTRYLLPTHLLGADGRRVRCTMCSHEWFQIPEFDDEDALPEALIPGDGGDSGSFADVLHQIDEDSGNGKYDEPILARDVIPEEKKKFFRKQPGLGTGLMAAILVAVLLMTGLLMFHGQVMKAWPNSIALYKMVGLAGPIPGDGLVFEDLKATTSYNAKGEEILRVVGNVRNVRSYPVRVPALRFALRDEHGTEVRSWSVESPGQDMESQSVIPLDVTYPLEAPEAKELNVKFVAE